MEKRGRDKRAAKRSPLADLKGHIEDGSFWRNIWRTITNINAINPSMEANKGSQLMSSGSDSFYRITSQLQQWRYVEPTLF